MNLFNDAHFKIILSNRLKIYNNIIRRNKKDNYFMCKNPSVSPRATPVLLPRSPSALRSRSGTPLLYELLFFSPFF